MTRQGVNMMEIRHLNTFLQVAMVQNFTKAGEILGYSQSNVSLHIHQLETAVGVPLFDRIGKRVTLTQYGQLLLPYAQRIVSTSTQIDNLFRSKESLTGVLRIGFVESLFECLFDETISKYHQQYPNITVEVTVDATSELLKKLHTSQLDSICIIDNYIADSNIHYWGVKQCQVVMVANPNHPLASRKNLRICDLSGQEFVLMEDTASYIVHFQKELLKEKVQISSFLKIQSPEVALKLVAKEKYLSLLPDYSVKSALHSGAVVKLDLLDFHPNQNVQFLIHKNKVLTPQIEGFLREVYAHFQSL